MLLVSGSDSVVMGGLALFLLAGAGALSVLVLHSAPPASVARVGTAGLVVGVSTTLVATAATALIGLFLGMVVAGVGFASGFQDAIRSVLPLASAQHRAGTEQCVAIADVLFREPRFTMLETIREYGLEQLESRGLPPHSDSSPGAAMR